MNINTTFDSKLLSYFTRLFVLKVVFHLLKQITKSMQEEPLCFQILFKLKRIFLKNFFLIMSIFLILSFYKRLLLQNFFDRLTCSYKTKAEPTTSFIYLDTARANVIQYLKMHFSYCLSLKRT